MLDIALGKEHTADMLPRPSEPPYRSAQCVYYHFAERDGTITAMHGYDNLDPEKYQVSFVTHVGDNIPKYRLMIRIVFNASTAKEMCESIQYINKHTRILDQNKQNMYISFTDYDEIMNSLSGLFQQE